MHSGTIENAMNGAFKMEVEKCGVCPSRRFNRHTQSFIHGEAAEESQACSGWRTAGLMAPMDEFVNQVRTSHGQGSMV